MLKKILAASTAGVLALSALATSAMAADAQNDPYTIVIEKTNSWDNQILEISASLTEAQMKSLLGFDDDFDDANGNDDKLNSYSNMLYSVWASNQEVKDKNNNQICADFSKAITVKSATVTADLKAKTEAYVSVAVGKNLTYNSAAPGDVPAFTTEAITEIKTVPVGITGQPAYNKQNAAKTDYEPDYTNVPAQSTSSSSKESKMATELKLDSVNNSNPNGKVTTPIVINGNFGLTSTKKLIGIDYENSKIDFTFEVEMSTTLYNRLVELAVAAGGSADKWNTSGDAWNNSYVEDILNSKEGQDVIGTYLGLAAESGTLDTSQAAGSQYSRKGGVTVKNSFTLKNKTENKGSTPADLVWADWDDNDMLSLGLGVNSTPTKLKNMNNGGTITFVFNGKVPANQFVSAEIVFRNASGASQAGVPLGSAFDYAEEGVTEITVPFPAGLTYAAGTTNPYKAFSFDITLNKSWTNPLPGADPSDPTVTGNFGLRRIVVKADKNAPADNNSGNGGLVSGDSTPSTSTPSSSTNSGTQSGEKNPGTGVAVAVAPVVLAAAGAAVVISKKRK